MDSTSSSQAKTIIFGFWLYLMSDCVLFAALFATYAVLHANTFGGPGSAQLFNLPFVLTETLILLTSTFTAGVTFLLAKAAIPLSESAPGRSAKSYSHPAVLLLSLALTVALGIAFLTLEVHEFASLAAAGLGPSRSAFLSSYFALVGTHGLHVAAGVLWMLVVGTHLWREGVTPRNLRRLTLVTLFWHFLDLIWIGIFSIVYLMGVL